METKPPFFRGRRTRTVGLPILVGLLLGLAFLASVSAIFNDDNGCYYDDPSWGQAVDGVHYYYGGGIAVWENKNNDRRITVDIEDGTLLVQSPGIVGTVWDSCTFSEGDLSDTDWDYESGIGAVRFQVVDVSECSPTIGHHTLTFFVREVGYEDEPASWLSDGVSGSAGADGPNVNAPCGDGIIDGNNPNDCLYPFWGEGPHVACGVGMDGSYWVFIDSVIVDLGTHESCIMCSPSIYGAGMMGCAWTSEWYDDVSCGQPVDDYCHDGADPDTIAVCGGDPVCPPGVSNANLDTLEACGQGPVCPSGVTSPPGANELVVVCGTPIPKGSPTGVKSCAVYNAQYNPTPYPNQNTGLVIEFDPPGPEGDVAFCVGAVTGPPCQPGEQGIQVNNQPTCAPNLCPQDPDPDTLAACGEGPACPPGLSNADLDTLEACGVGPVCPSGITSPPGSNELAVVCGQPVNDPCPGGTGSLDPDTLEACGKGPVCPSGLTSPPGPGQVIVVCGETISACSVSGTGPGPGWTVGANNVCIGLPWAEPGGATCPGATVNVRIHWGTTPGMPQNGTFDVCF